MAFRGVLDKNIPRVMGNHAGYVSQTYFAGAVAPHDVIRRHTLFGYFHLRHTKEWAVVREKKLIGGERFEGRKYRFEPSMTCEYLRWCSQCSDEELEVYGFSSWKTIHQIRSIHICHVHGEPLLLRCKQCGANPGDWRKFRLPGEPCPSCKSLEFEGVDIFAGTAYKQFVRDVAAAFENQIEVYRDKAWAMLVAKFKSIFKSPLEADNALSNYLYSKWGVTSLAAIGDLLQVRVNSTSGLFEAGAKSICFRILLRRAMGELTPNVLSESTKPEISSIAGSNTLFASTVSRHALLVGIDEFTKAALTSPGSIKDAAARAGLDYDNTFRKWKRVLTSMLAELGEDVVREMLPEGRRFNKVARVGGGQDLMAAYKHRISAVLQENPTHSRGDLWLEHFRAMKYLSVNDYDWLAKLIDGNMLSRRPRIK